MLKMWSGQSTSVKRVEPQGPLSVWLTSYFACSSLQLTCAFQVSTATGRSSRTACRRPTTRGSSKRREAITSNISSSRAAVAEVAEGDSTRTRRPSSRARCVHSIQFSRITSILANVSARQRLLPTAAAAVEPGGLRLQPVRLPGTRFNERTASSPLKL